MQLPLGSHFRYTLFMAKKSKIKVHPKKKRGRPATGKDPLLSARLPQELIAGIEKWAKLNDISRSEAVRRLLVYALRDHYSFPSRW